MTGLSESATCFLDNFVPECTEVVLQHRKGVVYVKFGEFLHKLELVGMNGSARDVDQGGQ
jgi:hypothetical protein